MAREVREWATRSEEKGLGAGHAFAKKESVGRSMKLRMAKAELQFYIRKLQS